MFVEAAAAGSGIPEAKAYLNGVNYARYLALRCGGVKAAAVVFACASGLMVGREGPLIHVGAVVGNALATWPRAMPNRPRHVGTHKLPWCLEMHIHAQTYAYACCVATFMKH